MKIYIVSHASNGTFKAFGDADDCADVLGVSTREFVHKAKTGKIGNYTVETRDTKHPYQCVCDYCEKYDGPERRNPWQVSHGCDEAMYCCPKWEHWFRFYWRKLREKFSGGRK